MTIYSRLRYIPGARRACAAFTCPGTWCTRAGSAARRCACSSAAYLPEDCPTCGASTWADEDRCGSWAGCEGVRRPGLRYRAHCQVCGYSVWTLVGDRP